MMMTFLYDLNCDASTACCPEAQAQLHQSYSAICSVRVTFPAQNVYHDGNYQYNGQCQVRRISVHDR